jgi:phosphatidylinositol glycan class F
MASTTSPSSVNTQGSPTQAPAEKPSPPPINILPSQLAQTYSYVHPVVLLGLYAYRFEALVANPVRELLTDLPWLAALQISYVILCLPPAGTASIEAGAGAEEEKKKVPKSPAGPPRHGKPGYRRKHSSGKISWAGVFAKLMV